MFDPEKLRAKIESYRLRAEPPPGAIPYTEENLEEFCEDIAFAIDIIRNSISQSFNSFYKSSRCVISGDKIHTAIIPITVDECPTLFPFFQGLTLPAGIIINFILEQPDLPGWPTLMQELRLYFREYDYEVHYEYGPQLEQRYPKPYKASLSKDEITNLLELISTQFDKQIASRLPGGIE